MELGSRERETSIIRYVSVAIVLSHNKGWPLCYPYTSAHMYIYIQNL
jgi:hypothetical protein